MIDMRSNLRILNCVAFKVFVDNTPADVLTGCACNSGDPQAIPLKKYFKTYPEFGIHKQMSHKLLIGIAPDRYLKGSR